jgi:AcrR family transcriptional regulator
MKQTNKRMPSERAENPLCDRILGAAFRAFTENGYAGTSTLEIATRAKVSKRDLYANFASKRDILIACIRGRAERVRLPPDVPAPQSRALLAATLTRFGTTIIREVSHPTVMATFRLAIAEAERSPEVAEVLQASRSVSRDALAGALAQAQAAGVLGRGDPRQMMEAFFALLWGDLMLTLLMRVTGSPKPAEIERRAHAATAAFLKLYGTKPSRPSAS